MIDPAQLLTDIIIPVLVELDMDSRTARQLVLGTAAQESNLRYIKQLDSGPALGLWQMEPATHDDIWTNWLRHRDKTRHVILRLALDATPAEMIWNLRYAAAMCRVHYRRFPGFPVADDIVSLAKYWKQHYNTSVGRGTVEEFVSNFDSVAHVFE